MNGDKHLTESSVAIVGLGLMGGSLAKALRGHCKTLLGCDLDKEALKSAREKDVVDVTDSNIEAILPQADFIVLATPVRTILELLITIPEFLNQPVVIMDLGSTKTEIVQAMERLPHSFDPVGGHPMCGKEISGLENSSGDLFIGAPFALTSLSRTTPRARYLAEEMIQVIGAKTIWMEPEIHDEWVAATSHLPYLLSVALTSATPLEVSPLVGPSFQSATRMSASSPKMMADIFLTNQEPVLMAISRYVKNLEKLEKLIRAGNDEQLVDYFEESLLHHRRLVLAQEDR